jgi:glutamyl-tRNA reductase
MAEQASAERAVQPGSRRMQIAVIGCNHRTAPVEFRERVAFTPEEALRAADELRRNGVLEEAVVLSTCNRSELYGVPGEAVESAPDAMEGYFTAFHQLTPVEWNGRLYRHADTDAVQHLFRVTSGLDSMLLGEAEILGQVRDAYRRALEHGSTGPLLNRLFQGALEVGKRVRAETELGARPMSVAFAGVKLAERVFGKLEGHRALIVGAGAMAEQVIDHLRNRGISSLRVVNRSREHAEELAGRLGGEAADWGTLKESLEWPNIMVTSVSAADAVLTRAMLEQAMEARSGRSLFIMDLGVPRNVESEVSRLYNVYLYNVDDLDEIVEQNKKAREAEIPRAEMLVGEHVEKFLAWQAGLEMNSLLNQLRAQFQELRQGFLRDRQDTLANLSPEDRQRVNRLTEEMVERLLEAPTRRLRHSRELRRRLEELEALRDLFGLGESPKDKP